MRRRRPKEWEDQSGDLMEQELRGKYAISMETVALVARIKVIFLNGESGLQTPLGWQKAAILMNSTSEVWRDPRTKSGETHLASAGWAPELWRWFSDLFSSHYQYGKLAVSRRFFSNPFLNVKLIFHRVCKKRVGYCQDGTHPPVSACEDSDVSVPILG